MKKILYKQFSHGFYTAGSQAWKSKGNRLRFLSQQRSALKAIVAGLSLNRQKSYHLCVHFYLKKSRIHVDIDNMLKEFNDIVFGKNRDYLLYSIMAKKMVSSTEKVCFWIYER